MDLHDNWRASVDECCRHFARTGEWIVLSDEVGAAIYPRLFWAKHTALLLTMGDWKHRSVIPSMHGRQARRRFLEWVLVDTWHQAGLYWTWLFFR